jgi:hypothetical protein
VPTSGSFLPVGTTTVTCTATDHAGNRSSASFAIVDKDARAQLRDLMRKLLSLLELTIRSGHTFLRIPPATANSLLADVANVRRAMGC